MSRRAWVWLIHEDKSVTVTDLLPALEDKSINFMDLFPALRRGVRLVRSIIAASYQHNPFCFE